MEKASIFGSDEQRVVNPNWFTGRVWMKMLSEKIGADKQDVYHVHFQGGARTKIHRHNGSQMLIVTEGRGSLETYEAKGQGDAFDMERLDTTTLLTGDVVHIRRDVLHTHGSVDASKTFSHIAINNLPCGVGEYVTQWYESDANRVTGRI